MFNIFGQNVNFVPGGHECVVQQQSDNIGLLM